MRLRRIAAVLLCLLIGIFTICIVRGLALRSQQVEVAAAAPVVIDEDGAVQRFAGALRIQTVSHGLEEPPQAAAFLALHDYLAQQFPRVHQVLRRETVADYSLLYTWPGRDPQRPPIILLSHLDVVPVEPGTEAKWTFPPFDGRIADGFIWGRGALDDKFGVLAILEAAEHLLRDGYQPAATIYFAFGHDEELGGPNGAHQIAKLLESRGVQAELVLDEGGSLIQNVLPGLHVPVACVGIAEKGSVSVELSVQIAGGHSSSPPKHTAVGLISSAVHDLELRQMPAKIQGPVRDFMERVGPHMSFAYRAAFANLWLLEPLIRRVMSDNPAANASMRTTTAATIINGGVKENVLPAAARAVVNYRILPRDSIADVVAHVRRVVAAPVEVRALEGAREASPTSPIDSPGFARLQRTIRATYPSAVVAPYLTIGGTDARHYIALSRSIYRFTPIMGDNSDLARLHGINERTATQHYLQAIRFFVNLLGAS